MSTTTEQATEGCGRGRGDRGGGELAGNPLASEWTFPAAPGVTGVTYPFVMTAAS